MWSAFLFSGAQLLLAAFIFSEYLTRPGGLLTRFWDRQTEAAETLVLVSALALLLVMWGTQQLLPGHRSRGRRIALLIGTAGTLVDGTHMAIRLAGVDVATRSILIDLVAHTAVAVWLLTTGLTAWRSHAFPRLLALLVIVIGLSSVAARVVIPLGLARATADGVLSAASLRWIQLNIWMGRGENAINAIWAVWLGLLLLKRRRVHPRTYASAVAR